MASKKVNLALTEMQRAFADAYMECWNGTESARLAGYSGSDKVLSQTANDNLKNPKIIAYIQECLDPQVMSANEVLVRLTNIARGDMGDFIDDHTTSIDLNKARGRQKLRLISRIKDKHIINSKDDTETTEMEIELYSALDALKTLAKYHQLITTQTLKVDWQAMAIEQIRAGRIQYDALAEAFDESLAKQLFTQAGVLVST